MATDEEVAGISIAVKANIKQALDSLTTLENKLGRITGKTVGISINEKSVQQAIDKAIRAQDYTVSLKADSASLIKSLGEVTIPVKTRWAGWEQGGEPPAGAETQGGPTPSGDTGGGVVPEGKASKKAKSQAKAAVAAPAVAEAATVVATPELKKTIIPAREPKTAPQRTIGPAPITHLGGVPLAENPLYQRYIAAGGDPAKFQAGTPGPLPGRATGFLEEFPALMIKNRARARTTGVDPRTERMSGAVPPTLGMQMPGGGWLPREEFNKLYEELTGLLKKGEAEAFLEQYPTSKAATEAIRTRVAALTKAHAAIPTEAGPERALAQEAVTAEAFAIARLQRQEIARRSVSKKEAGGMDPEDALALGMTQSRQSYLKLIGGQPQEIGATRGTGRGRRPTQPRPIKTQEDVDLLTVRDIVTDILAENQAELKREQGEGTPKSSATRRGEVRRRADKAASDAALAATRKAKRGPAPAGLFGAFEAGGPFGIEGGQTAAQQIQEEAALFRAERERRSAQAKAQLRGPGGRFAAAAVSAPASAVVAASPISVEDFIAGQKAAGKSDEEIKKSLAAAGLTIPSARTGGGGGGRRRGGGTAAGGEDDEETPKEAPRVTRGAVRQALGEARVEDIRQQSRTLTRRYRDLAADLTQQGTAIVKENPVRALSVAFGQVLVQTIGGRSRLEARNRELQRQANRLNTLSSEFEKAHDRLQERRDHLAKVREEGNKEEVAEAEKQVAQEREVALTRVQALNAQKQRVKEARAAVAPTRAEQARLAATTLAVGTVGIVTGTLVFGAALGAATFALDQLSIGMGRAFDRFSGFEVTANKVITALADQIRANGGLTEQTVAAARAQAGFSYETAQATSAHTEERAAVTAGTKAFEEQIEALHAEQFARERGVDQALIQTTGGFPIGQIGGQRSIRELIQNEFRAAQVPGTTPQVQAGAFGGGDAGLGFGLQQMIGASEQAVASQVQSMKDLREAVRLFNDDAKRGGSVFRLVEVSLEDAAAAADTLKESLPDTEEGNALREFVSDLAAKGFIIESTLGEAATSMADIVDFLKGAAAAPTRQDPRLLIEAQRKAIQTAFELRGEQGRFERQEILPARAFLRQAAQPLVPFEKTAAARTPGAEQAANFQTTKVSIDAAQASLREFADQGERAAEAMIMQAEQAPGGAGLMQQWKTAIGAVKQYGAAISALQIDMIWKQVNLQTKQYDEQLRVANRSLADALEYQTGIKQAGSDGLGLLERQTREYNKQSAQLGFQAQLLQQQMAQRQINFQVAIAGFTAPGITPEERAARIEEAKAEAAYAQQQLDIQKQQLAISMQVFSIAQQILNLNADRAVTDLVNQIALLQEGRRVNIELALDQENLAAMNQAIAESTAQAESVLQQAIDIRTQIIQIGASLAATAAAGFAVFVQELFEAFGIATQQAVDAISGQQYGSGYRYDQYGNLIQGGGGFTPYQAGVLGMATTATRMVVGEAGNEAVAILRNPRAMEIPTGEGGNQLTIIVTGNNIRSEEDIEELVERIAYKVEQIIGRRASQQGFRFAAR